MLILGRPGLRLSAQSDETYQVALGPPRLFLTAQRLRLLRRERERKSPRWQQFELLMAGGAKMPEEGFALALYYQASGDESAGRRAIEWALGPASDLRQLALVLDWCQPLLSDPQVAALAAKLQRGIERAPRGGSVPEARSRALAAVALADRAPKLSEAELRRLLRTWWRGQVVPALKSGRSAVLRQEFYALFELFHAIRDNLNLDLRESFPAFFRQLPIYQLISYYPASYPAAENEYRIPAVKGGQPDLRLATLSRAAELSMVAYDNNLVENQYLQGWAMHDRFLMRGPLGIPYEYLWANPYQPGLSYYNLPLVLHDALLGRFFVRSRWDDSAVWLGYFDGELQTFADGEAKVVPLESARTPTQFGDIAVVAGRRFTLKEEARTVIIVGLGRSRAYDIEADDREMCELRTDPGGMLELSFPQGFRGGIRLKEAGSPAIGNTIRES